MSLYNQVRPTSFDQIIGNDAQIKAVRAHLQSKHPPQVYLLTGPGGTGKTTLARIMANELGADELSTTEINSANNRGIDTAREIIDAMRYVSINGTPKVYIIDELHKTTADWQTAMLKPLEDTPENVYFFLCTTDPQKLNGPLKTRCTEIKLEALKEIDILNLLRRTLKEVNVTLDKSLLLDIADLCDGSPRAALVLLEDVLAAADIDAQKAVLARRLKGTAELPPETIEFCRVLLNALWPEVAAMLLQMEIDDPEKLRYAVLGYMTSVLLKSAGKKRAAYALKFFGKPFYDSGKSGVVLAAYETVVGLES